MNKIFISLFTIVVLFTACKHEHGTEGDHSHSQETVTEDLEPLAYTIYTEQSELFVEFKPLIIGETSKFAAHFTKLGNQFKSVDEGSVTVSLIGSNENISHKADSPSSPGIFRLALKPEKEGIYKLVFDIKTKDFNDIITIDNVRVFPSKEIALGYSQQNNIGDEIVYLKEQAWKIEFANTKITKQKFSEIIKTTGSIRSSDTDQIIITAKSDGVIMFDNSKKLIGTEVNTYESLFTISAKGFADNNMDARYLNIKANYKKAKADYDRAYKLKQQDVISQKDFDSRVLEYENAKIALDNMTINYSLGGQKVRSTIKGYIKDIFVSQGQYVEAGEILVSVSKNKKLILTAELPLKYSSKLSNISSVNFRTAYDNKVYNSDLLNGKIISYGKSVNDNSYFIPVNFSLDNNTDIIPGSFIEVFLKYKEIEDALIIPYSALIEEQGNYYAYVQTSGEGFQKRELKLGANDGVNIQVVSGIKENERVVTKGAYQIKLATMSGKMPAHGHEH
ncbi:MAG: efflux RND transporter periplasmic adaptor subunit [Flavobacteriaceae bacterium]|nr:efflux RND transporter periplasmic adaptor subunit [Flavobacteriaceae bacterium]